MELYWVNHFPQHVWNMQNDLNIALNKHMEI